MKHYVIYQVDMSKPSGASILFRSLKSIEEDSITLTLDAYKKVYEGDFEEDNDYNLPVTEQLFIRFNLSHPKDFKGHSLSVSDIIIIDGQQYICDNFGFKPISINTTNESADPC